MASEFAERQKNDFFRDMTSFASLWWYLIITFVLLITKSYDTFARLLIGLLLMYLIVVPIRTFHFKHRPKRYSYNSYIEKLDASSFPSLHSSRAVFMSLVLMKFFNNHNISALLAAFVVVVAYSRIHLKKHDLSDVLAGAVVGIAAYFGVLWIV
ncbi:phosphatase PAP2 family protein [Candidatus Woesearchaeota archaeon]|nr:phosphatase PAP2 family protein [Candidatus Woesearchaeota archaeon]